ncbi:MAG TPA: ATP phosphoribosyltransferase [Candidatus Mcinerneyibacteriales bacterium]|nr:ATP phosphoribosyltransferase [Candidatus Mcinerneyibacteriales bacterium]
MKGQLRLALPKGRIFENVKTLIEEAGFSMGVRNREYKPYISDPGLKLKIMKPQNVAELIGLGFHDAGFTGIDWVRETRAHVEILLFTGFDKVSIVAATPEDCKEEELFSKRVVVATEYVNLARPWLEQRVKDFHIIRSYGATEAFPPCDADMIIDNTSTGETLRRHGLKILDTLLTSQTVFVASPEALKDREKKEKLDELCMLFTAVLDARKRVMLEMNVAPDLLDEVVALLPAMRAPTVAPLYNEAGFSVKSAVLREEARRLIPRLKARGVTDILEYPFNKVVP